MRGSTGSGLCKKRKESVAKSENDKFHMGEARNLLGMGGREKREENIRPGEKVGSKKAFAGSTKREDVSSGV